jgi:hypothetical protein
LRRSMAIAHATASSTGLAEPMVSWSPPRVLGGSSLLVSGAGLFLGDASDRLCQIDFGLAQRL